MKLSVIFLILFLTGIAVNAETIVNVDKNMVKMKEKAHKIEQGFVTKTMAPKKMVEDATKSEVDPSLLND